jgi:hypothetical protein
MTISQTSGTTHSACARNLPQHFNGCTCVAGPNGTLGEALDVDLDLDVTPVEHTPTPALAAVIEAIGNDPEFGGDLVVTGDATASYDDPDGHTYEIVTDGTAIAVRDRDAFSIRAEAFPFVGSPNGQTAVTLLKDARKQARDLDSFNAAANEWLKTTDDEKGWGYEEPEFDQDAGTISARGVTIGGFTSDSMWRHGPEMTVTLAGDTDIHGKEKDPLVFTFARSRTGYAAVYRGEDTKALEHWEREALDGRVQSLMNRGGYLRSLTELYNDAARKALKGA